MSIKVALLAVAAAATIVAGCARSNRDKATTEPHKTVRESSGKNAAVDDEHIYEHGIPVDMYSVEDGVIKDGDYFSVIMDNLGVPQATVNELIAAGKKVFDVKNIKV